MDIWYYLMFPFTWLLKFFYSFFNSYGIAIILFSLAIKVILFPLSLKGKKSMIQMNMLSGKLQKLQKQYAKDQARYQEEMQKLYEKEGVNPSGGCLWSHLRRGPPAPQVLAGADGNGHHRHHHRRYRRRRDPEPWLSRNRHRVQALQ